MIGIERVVIRRGAGGVKVANALPVGQHHGEVEGGEAEGNVEEGVVITGGVRLN